MNEINRILKVLKEYVNSKTILEPPTKAEIIDKLCTLGVDSPGIDNTDIVNKIVTSVINSVKKYENYFFKRNREANIKFLSAINGGYHLINVFFSEDNIPSTLEGISIIVPVKGDKMLKTVAYIYNHLLSNRISFSTRISMFNRSDNLIINVYNMEDVVSLIKFCNSEFKDEMGMVNPFISKLGNVGVCKEINGRSYNQGISGLLNEYIEECILKQRKKAYDAIDFQNFVNEKYESADNYLDKNMYYIISVSLYAILTNNNVLKYLKSDIKLVFDYDSYSRYEIINISGDNEYMYNGNIINKDTNYIGFVKLQALNCLDKIHIEQYRHAFNHNVLINNNFTCKILEQLDYILKPNSGYNIKVNYKDIEIIKLLPYLYAFIAYKYKSCNIDEVRKLINIIKKTMIIENGIIDNKYHYIEDNQKITSIIPIINTSLGSVVIDIIDISSMMANISIIKRGKKDTYLNVYVKLDYNLLKDNISNKGREYRYKVARELMNDKRNKQAVEKRKTDFSALFLSI